MANLLLRVVVFRTFDGFCKIVNSWKLERSTLFTTLSTICNAQHVTDEEMKVNWLFYFKV